METSIEKAVVTDHIRSYPLTWGLLQSSMWPVGKLIGYFDDRESGGSQEEGWYSVGKNRWSHF